MMGLAVKLMDLIMFMIMIHVFFNITVVWSRSRLLKRQISHANPTDIKEYVTLSH